MAQLKVKGFKVIKLNPIGGSLPVATKKKKWEALGIEVTRYMGHPTCPFCGMQDPGADSPVRPDEVHATHCSGREPEAKPLYDGTFKGQAAMRTVRVPVRRVIPFPDFDADGSRLYDADGEPKTRFACSYDWKVRESYDWIWNGNSWQLRWPQQG